MQAAAGAHVRSGQWWQRLADLDLWFALVMAGAFWFAEFSRIWALVLIGGLVLLRVLADRRPLTLTPLLLPMAALLVLSALNTLLMPFERGTVAIASPWGTLSAPYDLVVTGRLIMGVVLALVFTERAARRRTLRDLLLLTVCLGVLVGVAALLASQWTIKSIKMQFIIAALPVWQDLPGAPGGFNVNEIAGAMAWLAPCCATLALYFWQRPATRFVWAMRALASAGFALLWAALLLGQSRFALAGVFPALGVAIWFLLNGRARRYAYAALGIFAVAQCIILSPFFDPTDGRLLQRDADSTTSRLLIWRSGLDMLLDYPLTGVGMNNYRAPELRALYPVEGYEQRVLPHAHNETIQVGADFGIPGLVAWVALHAAAAAALWRVRQSAAAQHDDGLARAVVLAAATGLLAHAVYGVGDAITLWDRFIFVFWWIMGLVGAVYAVYAVYGRAPRAQHVWLAQRADGT